MTQMTRIFADSERHADKSQHPLKNKGIAGQARNDEQKSVFISVISVIRVLFMNNAG